MGKNLLGDTDYAKGWDNRFSTSVIIGRVSELDCTADHADARIIMPDRVDHNGTPLITKPVPVMQVASLAKKSFAMPRKNTLVLMVKLPNGTSSYAVIGSFYSKSNPPPVTDPMLDYVIYDDGSTMQFDANSGKGELTWKLKGDVLWDNTKKLTIKQQQDIEFDGQQNFNVNAQADINLKPVGTCLIQGATIHLKGAVIIEGDITHTGNMTTSGVHTDSLGHHTSAAREDLEKRLAELEARVAQLEQLLPIKLNSTSLAGA
jgi:phage baseplate assembly protein V